MHIVAERGRSVKAWLNLRDVPKAQVREKLGSRIPE